MAKEIREEIEHEYTDWMGSIDQGLGRIYLKLERWAEARDHLQASYDHYRQVYGEDNARTELYKKPLVEAKAKLVVLDD